LYTPTVYMSVILKICRETKKIHGQNTGRVGNVVRMRTEINTHTVYEEESASDRRITLEWILGNSRNFRPPPQGG